jgi:glucose-1-phosphate thymidylyltransferase
MEPVGIMVVEDDGAVRSEPVAALAQVANRAIVDHALEALESAGVHEVLVVCSAAAGPDIRDCLAGRETPGGTRLCYFEDEGPIDVSRALTLAADAVDGAPCIVHVGSGMLAEPLMPLISHLQTDAPDVALLVHRGAAPNANLSGSIRKMMHIAELHPERAGLGLAGVLLLGPGALPRLTTAAWQNAGGIDLTSIADHVADAGGSLQLQLVQAWCRYAGDPLDLLELNRIALDRLEGDVRRSSFNGNQIEGRVWIHERASVDSSVIVGPAIIGAGARVADAYIGPYTSVGPGARIEGAEIERSIISADASVMHIGARLVASVVGSNARVFRDFSLPKALRLRVGNGTEVALC